MHARGRFARSSIVLAALLAAADAHAGGWLDASFGDGGKVAIDVGSHTAEWADAVTLDGAGNVYVAGTTDAPGHVVFAVAKLDPRGVPDRAFGDAGVAIADVPSGDYVQVGAVVVDADGGVLVGGVTRIDGRNENSTVVRFTRSGALDSSYGDGGRAIVDLSPDNELLNAMVFDADGRLYIAGSAFKDSYYVFAITALDATGHVDATFGESGTTFVSFGAGSHGANAMLRDEAGYLYVAGYAHDSPADMAIVKLDASGRIVTSFGDAGATLVDIDGSDEAVAIARDATGHLFLAGQTSVVELDVTGRLVTRFGDGGKLKLYPLFADIIRVNGIALDSRGDVYLAGTGYGLGDQPDFIVMQLDARGRLTRHFGNDGAMTIDFGGNPDLAYASAFVGGALYLAGPVNAGEAPENGDLGVAKVIVTPPPPSLHSAHPHPRDAHASR